MRLRVAALLAAFLLLAAVNPQADASIIPTLVSVTPVGDGTFTYTYNVDLAEDQNAFNDGATPGASTPAGVGAPSTTFKDYFTIYDFGGLVPASNTQPAGWTLQTSLVGSTPDSTNPADDPTIVNLTWVRTGDPDILGPADLGNFSARSTIGLVGLDNYTSDATRSQGATAGTAVGDIGSVNVPLGVPTAVPEPSTLLLLGGGMAGFGFLRRRRK